MLLTTSSSSSLSLPKPPAVGRTGSLMGALMAINSGGPTPSSSMSALSSAIFAPKPRPPAAQRHYQSSKRKTNSSSSSSSSQKLTDPAEQWQGWQKALQQQALRKLPTVSQSRALGLPTPTTTTSAAKQPAKQNQQKRKAADGSVGHKGGASIGGTSIIDGKDNDDEDVSLEEFSMIMKASGADPSDRDSKRVRFDLSDCATTSSGFSANYDWWTGWDMDLCGWVEAGDQWRPQLSCIDADRVTCTTFSVRKAEPDTGTGAEEIEVTRGDVFQLVDLVQHHYVQEVATAAASKSPVGAATCSCTAVWNSLRTSLRYIWHKQVDQDGIVTTQDALLCMTHMRQKLHESCQLYQSLTELLPRCRQWWPTNTAFTHTDVYMLLDRLTSALAASSSLNSCSSSAFLSRVPALLQTIWDRRDSLRQITRWDVMQITEMIQRQLVQQSQQLSPPASPRISHAIEMWKNLPKLINAVSSQRVIAAVADESSGLRINTMMGFCVVAKADRPTLSSLASPLPSPCPSPPPPLQPAAASAASASTYPYFDKWTSADGFVASTTLRRTSVLPPTFRRTDMIIECFVVHDSNVAGQLLHHVGMLAESRLVRRVESLITGSHVDLQEALVKTGKRLVVPSPSVWMFDPPMEQQAMLRTLGFRKCVSDAPPAPPALTATSSLSAVEAVAQAAAAATGHLHRPPRLHRSQSAASSTAPVSGDWWRFEVPYGYGQDSAIVETVSSAFFDPGFNAVAPLVVGDVTYHVRTH